MRKTIILILFPLFLIRPAHAQAPLSLADAVAAGLERNYDVRISGNYLAIARNNNTAGEAGYLPTVGLTGSYTKTISTSRQQYYDGRLREATNAASNSLTAGATLNWTLFDGFGMFIDDKRLDQLEKAGETSLRDRMEATTAEIITCYYSLVQQTKRLEVLREALRFGHERKALAKQRMELGIASELDYLKAVADLNADSATLLRQQADIINSRTTLNNLLADDATTQYVLTDTLALLPALSYSELEAPLESGSTAIELARQQKQIAIYESRLIRSVQYPQLNFTASYTYTKSTSAIGLIESNRNYGPSAGISLSYTLFDGFRNRRKAGNAVLAEQNAELALQQTLLDVKSTLYTVFSNYETRRQLVTLGQSNLAVVRNNVRIAMDKYRLGQLSDLDLRQTQLQQLEAENDLLQSLYEVKMLETELLRLAGRIIQ